MKQATEVIDFLFFFLLIFDYQTSQQPVISFLSAVPLRAAAADMTRI